MFKVMPKTVHQFSLAEILLMAAMNRVEARQRPGKNERQTPAGFISRFALKYRLRRKRGSFDVPLEQN